MTVRPTRLLLAALSFFSALAMSQTAAMAQTVKLTLIAPPSSVLGNNATAGNIYLSPYYFDVTSPYPGGATTVQALICDDFSDDIYQYESWTATTYTGSAIPADVSTGAGGALVGALGNTGQPVTTPPSLTTDYEEIGYLANQLLTLSPLADPNYATDQPALSFAIWDILNPTSVGAALGDLTANEIVAYNIDLTAAGTAAAGSNATNYLNGLTVYQPTAVTFCPAGDTCGTPQQFVTFNAPEALSPTFLAFDLLALFAALFLVRRHGISTATGSR